MLKTITTALFSFLLCTNLLANDYDDAWKAIHSKNFKEAKDLLLKATKNPATSLDAYLTLLYLQTYQGKESKIEGLSDILIQNRDKNPYLYSLWFNGATLGSYGKKATHQLSFLNKVLTDNSFNGSLQSASHYVKSMHYVFSHDFDKAKAEWDLMGTLNNWQLVGPFENLSGSGFNNSNGPITSADSKALFKAANNVEVSWFTPAVNQHEGWIYTYAHLPQSSAVIYAQTFVNAPEDMKVIINAGVNGSVKIWANDGLILSEAKERATELDYYKNYCTLKKGYNRILLQLGYTANSKPNYIVRITDENFTAIKNLTATSETQVYSKGADAATPHSIKHFAEEYFEKRIAADSSNLLNYILLSQTYLRDERTTEARQIIKKALQLSPENPLLKFELLQCLSKAENRTLLLQEIEWLKENDPESYMNYQIKVDNLITEEKYSEADEALTQWKKLYGEDEEIVKTKISILGKQKKVDDLFKMINTAYASYPENVDFVTMMFRLKKQALKDVKGALSVYEKYLKTNYNYSVLTSLADEYKEQGMNEKYLDILKELNEFAGYDPAYTNWLSKYYFEQQNYSKSMEYALQALKLAPYTGRYWNNLASIQEQMNKKTEAIASLRKAIYYDRTNYDARKNLSSLEQKADLYKLLPDTDAYAQIKKLTTDNKYDYSYVLDEKSTIIYDEGASEEYIHYAVKIHTQKGIDSWKESYIGYDSDNQTLLIEKCEVIKANGSKVPAERDGNEVVFTGLEAGDAVHLKYRIQNYSGGRLGREFWDKFNFNAFVPSSATKYTLIVPKNYQFNSQVMNAKIEPIVKEVDEYKVYKWEADNLPALKSESYMPPLNDVGTVLHISTLKTWADVANWYSDISYQNLTENFELNTTYNEIFADKKTLTNLQKAKHIYEYMLTNLRYSSVSFRQSGFIPQDVSKIITTRLGDCKDFSTLFVALAAKAGIPAQLVLIDTRDNGSKDMVLPSMEFNHCIVLAKIDGKDHYLELTDNNLAFGSLPNNLNGALSLLIPTHGQKSTETLKPLIASTRQQDKIIRTINVSINGKDERLAIDVKRTGHLTSSWRDEYATLPDEKKMENYEQIISNNYKNPVKLESLSWGGLTDLSDSLTTKYVYTVRNEVIEAGSMKMIKIPFIDLIATLDNFSPDKRDFPIEYWNYENTDIYETTVNIQLPTGQKFIEIPVNQNFSFNNNTYSIKYLKEGEKLKIIRSAKMNRENISATEYMQFKKFFNDIVEAESKYIVFK
jgi:tetratricopeptide (TPR) repeat protein